MHSAYLTAQFQKKSWKKYVWVIYIWPNDRDIFVDLHDAEKSGISKFTYFYNPSLFILLKKGLLKNLMDKL